MAGFVPTILLPLRCWNCRHVLPSPVKMGVFFALISCYSGPCGKACACYCCLLRFGLLLCIVMLNSVPECLGLLENSHIYQLLLCRSCSLIESYWLNKNGKTNNYKVGEFQVMWLRVAERESKKEKIGRVDMERGGNQHERRCMHHKILRLESIAHWALCAF